MTKLPEELEKRLYKTRLWKEGGSSFECSDYEGICADMEQFLATALEEQRENDVVKLLLNNFYEDQWKSYQGSKTKGQYIIDILNGKETE